MYQPQETPFEWRFTEGLIQYLTLYSVNMTYNLKKSIIQWESVCIRICLRPRRGSLSAQCVVLDLYSYWETEQQVDLIHCTASGHSVTTVTSQYFLILQPFIRAFTYS